MGTLPLMLFICLAGVNSQRDCNININDHLSKTNQPVLFVRRNNGLYLAKPEVSGSIRLQPNEELVLSCPGSSNKLALSGMMSSNCVGDQTLTMNVPSQNLECAKRVVADIDKSSRLCGDQSKGKITQIGFKAPGSQLESLVTVCHNIDKSFTYYTKHTVSGALLRHKTGYKGQTVAFLKGDDSFFKDFDPDFCYKQKEQHITFQRLLGNHPQTRYFSNDYLARGHLTPAADFVYGSWKVLTYFFINAAPQWQSINGGGWLQVENYIRTNAIAGLLDLEVMTGTYGVLKLPDLNGNLQEIYLETGNRLPVPELYWKLIRNPNSSACMGIVSINNPFPIGPIPYISCPLGTAKKWTVSKHIYYCSYNELRNIINYIPNMNCVSLLVF